ncbi:MAG: hypothetical protein EOM67_16750, partial [Spirochaetia bacterium]|nr:hypothetical protein [Spirochaetia bacterium]
MKRLALVIDTNDSDKQGKIKLRILPEMNMMSENHLPWARPQIHNSYGLSKEEGSYSHKIPELDTLVYCEVSDDWTSFYYLDEIPFYGPGYSYEDTLSFIQESIEELEEQTYPQPSYTKTKDGTVEFHNTETGESGIIYPSGTYFHVRSDGTLKVQSGETSVEILENGSIQLTGSNVSFLFDNENKKLILTDVENLEIAGIVMGIGEKMTILTDSNDTVWRIHGFEENLTKLKGNTSGNVNNAPSLVGLVVNMPTSIKTNSTLHIS